eukprot:m.564928 g.564928  ORF g.564928 m.564928 type:complete len:94 (+) comp22238_c0_seq9:1221-1502(+)
MRSATTAPQRIMTGLRFMLTTLTSSHHPGELFGSSDPSGGAIHTKLRPFLAPSVVESESSWVLFLFAFIVAARTDLNFFRSLLGTTYIEKNLV